MSETTITWNLPNFITVGLISVLMMALIGFGTSAISKTVRA